MYIITGGAGFIGSAMIWGLNRAGVTDILVVDHLGSTEKWKNLVNRRYVRYAQRAEFLEMLRGNALGGRWRPWCTWAHARPPRKGTPTF